MDFILRALGHPDRFSSRAMFGEYALYADGAVVALVCDETLYVKILPASLALESLCEKDSPYPGAKPHYVLSEDRIATLHDLPCILFALAAALPPPKKRRTE